MDKEIIKKNFSRYAQYYDRYATIQNLSASGLISRLEGNGFSKILDIGCGTGNYTKLLKDRFPLAQVKAVDISKEMIEIAKEKIRDKRIEFIIADGETASFREKFDFISSNATFQWFENLDKTLSRYKEILGKNGLISFSTFGPLTFYQLNASLKELFGKDVSISSCNFIEAEEIRKILKRLFKEIELEERIYKENFRSLKELLKKIKYTGTRGNGAGNGGIWTPKTINALEKIYKKRFKAITATYQIFFCKAGDVSLRFARGTY